MPQLITDLRNAVLPHDTFWAIDETAGRQLWMMLQHQPREQHVAIFTAQQAEAEIAASSGMGGGQSSKPYEMVGNTALLRLSGPMTKQTTSLSAGTSTVRLRRMVRQAGNDPDVKSICLVVDSPGGSVSGTADLADDIAKVAKRKPLYGFAEDWCASAAMWTISQAARVYGNRTLMAGSIGTVMVVYDMSRMAANEGIDVLVFATGQYKGAGTPGTVITEPQKVYFQSIVDGLNRNFAQAVADGRRLSLQSVQKIADGRMYHADEALKLGLIDGISTLDDVLDMLAEAEDNPNYGQSPAVLPDDDPDGDPDDPAGSRANGFDKHAASAAEDHLMPQTMWEKMQQFFSGVAVEDKPGSASAGQPAAIDPTQAAEIERLMAENEQLRAAKAVDAATTLANEAAATLEKNVGRVDAAVKDLKLVPAAAEHFKQLAKEHPAAFDTAFAGIEAQPPIAALAGGIDAAKVVEANAAANAAGDAFARLDTLAKAYMKDHQGVKHHEALTMVSRENPDLAAAAYSQSSGQ